MSDIYADCHRALQDRYDQRALADRTAEAIVHDALTPEDAAFIESRDFFFLTTIDPDGNPTVSYKGGAPGFVKVEGNAFAFPCYDGNGMFLSMGNITHNPNVGLLFMDFERGRRLRVQGTARLDESGARDAFPGALFLVRIEPRQIFVNCPRYVHKYQRVEASKYVPAADGTAPLAQWKRLEIVFDTLSPEDQAAVKAAGFLSLAEYQAKVEAGLG